MDLNGKKIFVTGADGFIGSHLTEELVGRRHDVRAFVCYNSFHSSGWLDYVPAETKNEIQICQGDIRDPYRVKEAMRGCDIVFHLAALIAIPYSYYSPGSYIDTNINGTL
ncbi:MAG TPA: GDP-mannose 4,6-dehydratase, partial [Anaerovoracaceae bacterium]|nr:GDP-mannose 4,6-dehydratase [Anaerovoracaceae bacterium]